jgi:hypothetical protein
MIALAQAARSERDTWVRELAQGIIWAQVQWILEGDEALRRLKTADGLAQAARGLRLQGYERCPTCEGRLSDVGDWKYWAALGKAEIGRLEALERGGEVA